MPVENRENISPQRLLKTAHYLQNLLALQMAPAV